MIGVIGLGAMGHGIAGTLVRGFKNVLVYDIDPAKMQTLVGAVSAESCKEVARKCETIILSLPTSGVTVRVIEEELLPEVQPETVIVDTGTTVVRETQRLCDGLKERGAHLLDAPVSGGPIGAARGSLLCFVGGDRDVAMSRWPLLKLLAGSRLTHCGPSGYGQIVKGVNQLAMGLVEASYTEAMAYGVASGVDPATILEAVSGGQGWRADFGRVGSAIVGGTGEQLNCKYSEYDYFLDEADRVGFDAPILRAVKSYLSRYPETHIDNINRPYPPIWSALTGGSEPSR
ncbi:MAG: NAD(P)-dependent oxidoreductase [Spirochaetales bacterium]|nr:MAG: NAD(P)-dependent oxidoreductase [Spirochaetales bacterium]